MSDGTSESHVRPAVFIVDVVKKRLDPHNMDILDSWDMHRLDEIVEIADFQHAMNRALLRELGRAESNATATPEARLQSNHYPDEFSALEGRIREFFSYGEDWDGDGAKEIPPKAIYSSLNFLAEFRCRFSGGEPLSAAPSPDGEIALYWHSPTGYAEVNFDGSGKLSMCWSADDEEFQFIEEEVKSGAEPDSSQVWATLSKFLGQLQQEETVQTVL